MKYVRTARGYQALKLEDDNLTVNRDPQEVSNELAEKVEKVAEEAGVPVVVVDSDDNDAVKELHVSARSLTKPTPDLAAGVAYVTGSGDPVQTPGLTPEGETPAQAQTQQGADVTPAVPAPGTRATATPTASGSGSSSNPA